ncbi:hypothetical protein [Peijinzhouia sedimentorum]
MKNISAYIIFCLLIFACKTAEEKPFDQDKYDWESHEPFVTDYGTFNMPRSGDFTSTPIAIGPVSIPEASGLAYSVKNPGMIWTHNDSGNTNTLFLLDATTGEIVSRYQIEGTVNLDWEDMEISINPNDGEPYLYIGNTGDNSERRPVYSIYRFLEPVFEESHRGQNIKWTPEGFSQLNFNYPDGSHDAETILVDPATQDIYVVTKRDVVSTLYVAPYPQSTDSRITLYKAGLFSFREASAGNVSLDGSKVLIKNRQEIFYWTRLMGESMVDMLSRTPLKVPYLGEPQGEAISFDANFNYFTLSEELNSSVKPTLYKYEFKSN